MFDIQWTETGTVRLVGRFDASQVEKARELLSEVDRSTVLDFAELQYISSAGLGILFATQKKLMASGQGLKLINLNPHIREIFSIAGFDTVFEVG